MSLSAKASTDEVTSSHSIRVGFFKRALEGKKEGRKESRDVRNKKESVV